MDDGPQRFARALDALKAFSAYTPAQGTTIAGWRAEDGFFALARAKMGMGSSQPATEGQASAHATLGEAATRRTLSNAIAALMDAVGTHPALGPLMRDEGRTRTPIQWRRGPAIEIRLSPNGGTMFGLGACMVAEAAGQALCTRAEAETAFANAWATHPQPGPESIALGLPLGLAIGPFPGPSGAAAKALLPLLASEICTHWLHGTHEAAPKATKGTTQHGTPVLDARVAQTWEAIVDLAARKGRIAAAMGFGHEGASTMALRNTKGLRIRRTEDGVQVWHVAEPGGSLRNGGPNREDARGTEPFVQAAEAFFDAVEAAFPVARPVFGTMDKGLGACDILFPISEGIQPKVRIHGFRIGDAAGLAKLEGIERAKDGSWIGAMDSKTGDMSCLPTQTAKGAKSMYRALTGDKTRMGPLWRMEPKP